MFEASSTWLSFLLDECDKAYRLYRNERQLPPLKQLPSETFFEHCMTGFEGDEAPPPRFPEFYGDILIWSSDVYHHDGDDAWRAMETMQKYDLPVDDQAKFLGANARRLYNIDRRRRRFIRERVTEIERPDWWPTEEEVQAALAADALRDTLVDGGRHDQAHFAVFDSDSHVVEPPELWEKYLEPEYRTLGKHALWRHEGATNSYLKVNGEIVPRHDESQPAAARDLAAGHDLGRRSASSTRRRHPMNEGASDPQARLADMDAMGVDQAFLYPTWFAEGLPPRAAIPTSRMRWRGPTTTGSPISARPRRTGCSPPRCCRCRTWTSPLEELRRVAAHPVLPRRLHPADVHRGPLFHPSVLRPAVGGAGTARTGRRGAPDAGPVEPGMDLARTVLREDQEPARSAAAAGRRRRPVRRRRQRRWRARRSSPASRQLGPSDGADPVGLAGQSHVRRLDADRLSP